MFGLIGVYSTALDNSLQRRGYLVDIERKKHWLPPERAPFEWRRDLEQKQPPPTKAA